MSVLLYFIPICFQMMSVEYTNSLPRSRCFQIMSVQYQLLLQYQAKVPGKRKGNTRDKSKAGHDDGTGYVSLPSLITRLVRSIVFFMLSMLLFCVQQRVMECDKMYIKVAVYSYY